MTRESLSRLFALSAALLLAALATGCGANAPQTAARGGDNSCEFAFDGDCDEPRRGTGLCAPGTDTQDCSVRNPGPNSCQFAYDDECDHPNGGTGACPPNTDVADCRSVASRGSENSCQFAYDNECDHPGVGTGACPPSTDVADCQSTRPVSGENSCRFAFDGECDHPDVGTGACAPKTDMADCRSTSIARAPPGTQAGRPPAIPRNARPTSSGTGFYINSDGDLVTNHHVIDRCYAVGVWTDREVIPASTVLADRNLDIAVMRTDRNPGGVALLRSESEPSLGQRVYVVGYPLLGALTSINFTEGLVSSLTGFRGDVQALQTSAAVQSGNSGGPLLDEGGVVIGVVSARIEDAENVGFAIRAEELIRLLRRQGIEYRGAGALTPERTETIATRAAQFTYPILCYGRR